MRGLLAKVSIMVHAPKAKVWEAFVNPDWIRQYMFGAEVISDWKGGSPIVWRGEWEGKRFEDKGVIKRIENEHLLEYSHYSPMTGKPDIEENYHNVVVELSDIENGTEVRLTQDNNVTESEAKHSERNWKAMLEMMKDLLEKDELVSA